MATVEEIIRGIDQLREELKAFLSSGDYSLVSEQINRWANRAHTQLSEWGLPDDANRLSGAQHSTRMNDLRGNVLRKAKARDLVLKVLRDEMHKHPDYYRGKVRQLALEGKESTRPEKLRGKIFLGHGRHPLWARVQLHLQQEL